MKIYFAGSITGGREDKEIYKQLISELSKFGKVLTEHVGDIHLGAGEVALTDQQIHDRDISWLSEADCLVAEVTTPSLGVGYEISTAKALGKPILCLFRPDSNRRLSAMIAGCGNVVVRHYTKPDEIASFLKEFVGKMRTLGCQP